MLGSWDEHVDELLYDGEREQRRVDLEAATVVVTNDRILVLTPDGDGSNYRHVERPNVARVSVETDSALRQLFWATVALFLGLGVLIAAVTYDLASLVDGGSPADSDTFGVAESAREIIQTLLTALDLTVLAGGVLLVAIAAAFFVRYVRSRSRRLVIRVSGDDDIVLPVTDEDLEADRTVDLAEAIGPGPTARSEGVGGDPDPIPGSEESG
ncbi:hypothetical protein [Natronorubrum halophilum]|uniref:hypothetical protein n=1 Tax=Natronorubrum halophilum TaxID=1702106 RepID=UPI0010C22F42|nr:hypothetical protein [Natronorubrum halophilum]